MADKKPAGKRQVTTYDPAERFALMLEAVQTNPYAVAREHNIPKTTLYGWFEEFGGLGSVRAVLEEAAVQSQFAAVRAIYDEVAKRATKLGDEQLMVTFRHMLEQAKPAGEAPQAGPAQAQQVVVQVYANAPGPDTRA